MIRAAEDELRRHGPDRFTVVGVGKHLGVTHAAIYRHYPSKRSLFQAITERWLEGVTPELESISRADFSSWDELLKQWFRAVRRLKLERIDADPELFAMYGRIAPDVVDVVGRHVSRMLAQLERVVELGVLQGAVDAAFLPPETAEALWSATARFHNPKMLAAERPSEAELDKVLCLLLRGLRVGS